MSELLNNPIFQTIISGVFVFIFSQIIQDFFIKPIQKQRNLINQISDSLSFYGNLYCNLVGQSPKELEDRQTMYEEFRNLGCQLASTTYLIPFYNLFNYLKILPSKENVISAKSDLIGLSNGSWPTDHNHIKFNDAREKNLKKRLKINF